MRYNTDFNGSRDVYLCKVTRRHIFFSCGYSLQENRAIFSVSTRLDDYASNNINWIIFVSPISSELSVKMKKRAIHSPREVS